jgi:hypothetical protein
MKFATRNIIWYYRTYFPHHVADERISFLKKHIREIAEHEGLLHDYIEGIREGEEGWSGRNEEISPHTLEKLRCMGWPGECVTSSMGLDKQF